MNTILSRKPFQAVLATILLGLALLLPARAQSGGTGMIEGRVLNVTTGSYLNNARVTVEGTTLQGFTNDFGEYRLVGVAAGAVTLRVFYTGLAPQVASVAVVAGQTAIKNFSLTQGDVAAPSTDETVKLDVFVVASTKETNASAIAINEQRFAGNLKNVVAADEFGTVTEGNVGEFLKFLPGVTLDYTAADARSVSVRGMPSTSSAVTVDGNRIANTGAGVANRVFEFDQLSINNVSRIEVTKGPTPESPADAIGGTINLISKGAFERSRAEFTYRVVLSMNQQSQQDVQYLSFGASPGPGREPRAKVLPGFDFTYVNPVTNNFGFTLTGLNSNIFNNQYQSAPHWSPTSNSGSGGTLANPVMSSYTFYDGPKPTSRYSMGATLDWRIRERDVLSVGGSWNAFDATLNTHVMVETVGAPTSFDPTFTQGGNAGSFAHQPSTRKANRATYVINVKYRHDGPIWKINGGGYFSHSKGLFRDVDFGFFQIGRAHV